MTETNQLFQLMRELNQLPWCTAVQMDRLVSAGLLSFEQFTVVIRKLAARLMQVWKLDKTDAKILGPMFLALNNQRAPGKATHRPRTKEELWQEWREGDEDYDKKRLKEWRTFVDELIPQLDEEAAAEKLKAAGWAEWWLPIWLADIESSNREIGNRRRRAVMASPLISTNIESLFSPAELEKRQIRGGIVSAGAPQMTLLDVDRLHSKIRSLQTALAALQPGLIKEPGLRPSPDEGILFRFRAAEEMAKEATYSGVKESQQLVALVVGAVLLGTLTADAGVPAEPLLGGMPGHSLYLMLGEIMERFAVAESTGLLKQPFLAAGVKTIGDQWALPLLIAGYALRHQPVPEADGFVREIVLARLAESFEEAAIRQRTRRAWLTAYGTAPEAISTQRLAAINNISYGPKQLLREVDTRPALDAIFYLQKWADVPSAPSMMSERKYREAGYPFRIQSLVTGYYRWLLAESERAAIEGWKACLLRLLNT